jgi:hypothetical protein
MNNRRIIDSDLVDTGVPYIEDPLTARLFVDKYRLLAEMDSDPGIQIICCLSVAERLLMKGSPHH